MKVGFILLLLGITSVQAQVPRTWQHMDLGSTHTCAISTYGQLSCWGNNYSGEVGVGVSDVDFFNTPQNVNLRHSIYSVDLGGTHACVTLTDGSVKCWGSNRRHLLGPNLHRIISPTDYELDDIPTKMSIGHDHACYILADKTAKCWGENFYGQLGTGSTNPRLYPQAVLNEQGIEQIETGGNFSCLLNDSGQVKCWGNNYFGQLGIGFPPWRVQDTRSYLLPQSVDLESRAIKISTGKFFGCALMENNRVSCWGNNQFGQLGIGSRQNSALPQYVDFIDNAVDLAAGDYHACAVLSDSSLQCWGNNQYGQLGNGNDIAQERAVNVDISQNIHSISLGKQHSCALLNNGVMKCWGDNINGQLGIGNNVSTSVPQTVY